MKNIILATDSYKASHYKQYPSDVEYINSYIEARGISKDIGLPPDTEIVHMGVQMFIQEYLSKPITIEDINEASEIFTVHGEPFNRSGWERIVSEHGGYLPLLIQSLPEGTPVRPGVCTVQVRNLDPTMPWLTSYIETALLRAVWYPSTVATVSREIKKLIYKYLLLTNENVDSLEFKLHDFGARGVSSSESAGVGGLAHLVNFMGTDTIEAILAARKYYDATMPGFSIPASEHSTMTSWGKSKEKEAYKNMVEQFGKDGSLFAVVSDSYDIYNAVKNIWGGELLEYVKEKGSTVVIRPDSGTPAVVVMQLLDILENRLGSEIAVNRKGYKVLPKYVRLIQGDGVNYQSIKEILECMKQRGWSADNIAFGMGGALLQKVNRDTFKYAMKASALKRTNSFVWEDVFKEPITDPGKNSKKGILQTELTGKGQLVTVNYTEAYRSLDQLVTVYECDRTYRPKPIRYTFSQVRENAKI